MKMVMIGMMKSAYFHTFLILCPIYSAHQQKEDWDDLFQRCTGKFESIGKSKNGRQ